MAHDGINLISGGNLPPQGPSLEERGSADEQPLVSVGDRSERSRQAADRLHFLEQTRETGFQRYARQRMLSGLLIIPSRENDLLATVKEVIAREPTIPNQRIVLDIIHWDAEELPTNLLGQLQLIADDTVTTICLRTSPEVGLYNHEIIPALLREQQKNAPPLAAMPLSLSLIQTMQLRQELRLELRQEQTFIYRYEQEQLFDDYFTAETAPRELIKINDLLAQMTKTIETAVYLNLADQVLDEIFKTPLPYFRMMGVCYFAEELSHQPSLRNYVEELYNTFFTQTFNSTSEEDRPSLALLVAASQLRAGIATTHVAGLLDRAIHLAKTGKISFRGRDARNFSDIIACWSLKGGDVGKSKQWVDAFVELEDWIASPSDLAEKMDELAAERAREEAVEVEETEIQEPMTREPLVQEPAVQTHPVITQVSRNLSQEEKSYVKSRLTQLTMKKLIDTRGFDQEVFHLFMRLAQNDPWEETAVAAFHLILTHNRNSEAQLRSLLGHFSSPYYKSKADWVISLVLGRDDTEAKRQAMRALFSRQNFTGLITQHEELTLSQVGTDPLAHLLPNFNVDDIPLLDNAFAIDSWAKSLIPEEIVTDVQEEPIPVTHSEVVQAEEDEEPVDPRADDSKRRQTKEKKKAERKAELYLGIAVGLLEQGSSLENLKQALAFAVEGSSPRALALFMGNLPSELSDEFLAEANRVVEEHLAEHPYYEALARVCLVRLKGSQKNYFKDFAQALGKFVKIASESEEVANVQAISDITFLARAYYQLTPSYKKLMALAQKRLDLFKEEVKDLDWIDEDDEEELETSGVRSENDLDHEEEEENIGAGAKKRIWQTLYKQGQANILASSLAENERGEIRIARTIERFKNPYYKVWAFRTRAQFLAGNESKADIAQGYMTRAVELLPLIEQESVRVAVAMEMEKDLAGQPLFAEALALLPQALNHDYGRSEIARLGTDRTRVAQGDWYPINQLVTYLQNRAITHEVMGRLLTSKQLSRLLQRNDFSLSPTDKARLMMGHMQLKPYQNAFETIKQLIEAEEKQGRTEYFETLFKVLGHLSNHGDKKAGDYIVFKQKELKNRLTARTEAQPLKQVEWLWIDEFCRYGLAREMIPLINSNSMTIEDRLELLEKLATYQLVDQDILTTYHELKARGEGPLLFNLMAFLHQLLPGMKITRSLLSQILSDPRIKEEGGLETVIADLANPWERFEKSDLPEERIQALADDEVLCQMYYQQEATQIDFGSQPLSYERFQKIVKIVAGKNYNQDFSVLQNFEKALEQSHPTMGDQRVESQNRIAELPDISDDDTAFLLNLVNSNVLPGELDILRIRQLGIKAEVDHPENALTPNLRSLYRLYFGKLPLQTSAPEGPISFARMVTPGQSSGAKKEKYIFHPAVTFRLDYREMVDVLKINWSLREIRKLLEENPHLPEMASFKQQLEEAMAGQQSQKDIAITLNRLHQQLIMETSGKTKTQATGQTTSERNHYLSEEILPQLLKEQSHFVLTDSLMLQSAKARQGLVKRGFDKIYPQLEEFAKRPSAVTETKRKIAADLNLSTDWQNNPREKTRVELELLSQTVGLDPVLRGRFFDGFAEHLSRQVEAEAEKQKEALHITQVVSRGRFIVSAVDKREIYTHLRIGDFRPCCIATDGSCFGGNMPGFFLDRMTQVFAIVDPDTRKAVGHMVGHFGLAGAKEEPVYLLNGLYLRHQYRSESNENAILDVLESYLSQAGISVIRHGINQYHDLTQKPPAGYSAVKAEATRLVSITHDVEGDRKPILLYNDLGFNTANEPQQTTHYQKRIQPTRSVAITPESSGGSGAGMEEDMGFEPIDSHEAPIEPDEELQNPSADTPSFALPGVSGLSVVGINVPSLTRAPTSLTLLR